jgi:hypothetical protein
VLIGRIFEVLIELGDNICGPFLPVFARAGARHGPMATQGRLRAVERSQPGGDPCRRLSDSVAFGIVDRSKYVHGIIIREF